MSDLFLLFLSFCIGIYIVPVQLMHADLTFIPGDLADGRLNNYFLEHGYKWLTGQVSSFWNAPFFYPAARVMSFSDNHLGTLPIYALFRAIRFDRETSYQLWFFAVFTLNYFSCAWVLKKLSINALGAAAGAFIFTFSLPVFARMGHSQLLPRFMMPLAFYFAFTYLTKRDVKSFAFLCLCVVVQFYCTIYMGFFLILGLTSLFLGFFCIHRDWSALRDILFGSWSSLLSRMAIMVISFLLLMPLMLPYYQTSLELGMRPWGDISPMLPRLQSYLMPAYGTFFWSGLFPIAKNLPMSWEHQIFTGAIPLVSVLGMPVVYYRRLNDPLIRLGMAAFIAVFILFCMTLYFGSSLYFVVSLLPGLRSVRAVTRIMLMNLFLISLIVGVCLTKIQESRASFTKFPARILMAVFVLSAVTADQYAKAADYMSYSKSAAQGRSRAVKALVLKKAPQAKIIAFMPDKSSEPLYYVHLDAMMAAQDLHMATINGYSGNLPHGYFETFYDQYDQCGSLMQWKGISTPQYDTQERRRDLFKDMVIAGRDSCVDGDHTFSFMNGPLPESGYRAQITFATPRVTATRGRVFTLSAFVKNASAVPWASLNDKEGGKYKLNISYRWLSYDHTPLGGFDSRHALPYDLDPGENVLYGLTIKAPVKPGTYYLEFDVVQELVAWFHEKGSATSLIKVVVL